MSTGIVPCRAGFGCRRTIGPGPLEAEPQAHGRDLRLQEVLVERREAAAFDSCLGQTFGCSGIARQSPNGGRRDAQAEGVLNTLLLAWDADRLLHGLHGWWDLPIFHPYTNVLAVSENLLGIALFTAPIPRHLVIVSSADGRTWETLHSGRGFERLLLGAVPIDGVSFMNLPLPPNTSRLIRLRQTGSTPMFLLVPSRSRAVGAGTVTATRRQVVHPPPVADLVDEVLPS